MSSETTTATVNTASKQAAKAAAAVSGTLPTVVETVEVAMEVPSKVVLNQKLVVTVAVVGGMALGAGILYGVNQFRVRRSIKNIVKVAGEAPTHDNSAEV